MKKKTDRQKLKEKLDKICREIILIRDDNRCQKCGKYVEGQNAHCSHVIPKSKGDGLRWNFINLKLLCFHCHINWWHKNPLEAAEWFKGKFPKRWEILQENKNIIEKYTINKLEEMFIDFNKDLREIKK